MSYPPGKSSEIRVRFAPSPTGPLHVGNVRTAIFNWLFAKRNGGKFILRLEDTDVERSKPEYADEIVDSLSWLGIQWDEGPYYQSSHATLYGKMLEQLIDSGMAYPCFCPEEMLEEERKLAARKGVPYVYSGRCASLHPEEQEKMMKLGPCAWRFRVGEGTLSYKDAIRGEMSFDAGLIGDFILVRSNGRATYNFAAAVDDAMMRISHVIRGEDHISNTPRQMLIINALGHEKPVYAHLPLIVSDKGTKLSKRDIGASFSSLIAEGYLPEAVFNFLALIGWSPEGGKEDMGMGEMAKEFSLSRVAVRPAKYDMGKLEWFNGLKIRSAKVERLLEMGQPFVKKHVKEFARLSHERKLMLMDAVRQNISHLTDLGYELAPFFELELKEDVRDAVAAFPAEKVISAFVDHCESPDYEIMVKAVSDATGLRGKSLYLPIRIALTGRAGGPELKKVYDFLSPADRIERAKSFLEYIKE